MPALWIILALTLLLLLILRFQFNAFVALLLASPPSVHLLRTWWRDRNAIAPLPRGYADDVSRLNRTLIAEVWDMPADSRSTWTFSPSRLEGC